MRNSLIYLSEKVANLSTKFVALWIAVIGIFLLFISEQMGTGVWKNVIGEIASLLFVSAAIGLLWELCVKRAFLDEILAKTSISKDLTLSGITKITHFQSGDIPWQSYFKTVHKLDIFFSYARTWRNTHEQEFKSVAKRHGARLQIVLPDPEDQQTVLEMARRFSATFNEIKKSIKETEVFLVISWNRNQRMAKYPYGYKAE